MTRINVRTRIFASLVCFTISVGFAQAAEPLTVPALRNWTSGDGQLALAENVRIMIESTSEQERSELRNVAEILADDLWAIAGIKADIVQSAPDSDLRGNIVLFLGEVEQDITEGGYLLNIDSAAHVRASSVSGVFYGTQTILQWLKQSSGERLLPKGQSVDSPQFRQRGIMLDVGRKYFEVSYLEQVIRNLAWLKMNSLHLHFSDWTDFRLVSDVYPGLASEQAYSKADIRYLQDIAKRYHVDIVPEIDLPAHATVMTEYAPELGFKCPSMRAAKWQKSSPDKPDQAWTIDITKEANRQWIEKLLHEFVPLFDSKYFHIGGDEYQYDEQKNECPELIEAMTEKGFDKPGDIFIEWLNETNELIKSHGKTTQIWNWWRFLDNSTSIQPSKDIIINVWNLPRQKEIISDGYQVVLTPESLLYVSPGLEDPETGYGIFDARKIYEDWSVGTQESILGYKVSIWSDEATFRTDQWFEGKSYEPKAVVAEKNWGRDGSGSFEAFLARLNKVGVAPPVRRQGKQQD